jgi:hypothetical protein
MDGSYRACWPADYSCRRPSLATLLAAVHWRNHSVKHCVLGLLVFGFVISASASAVEKIDRRYPPRFQRGSFAEYKIVPRNGCVTVRQVYSGYTNGFPVPAAFFYGYPHSNDATGIGF